MVGPINSNDNDTIGERVLVSKTGLLLSYSTRFYDRQVYTRSNLNMEHAAKFQDMLQAYFRLEKHLVSGIPTVAECGDHMGMSGAYLSDLLKEESGMGAQEHAHHFVVNKAKTQLLNSNDTVGQTAYSLGFEYLQHFSRVFKAKRGEPWPIRQGGLNQRRSPTNSFTTRPSENMWKTT